MISPNKLKVISNIQRDIGQVVFASTVIGPLLAARDLGLIILGLLFSICFWSLSIILIKD